MCMRAKRLEDRFCYNQIIIITQVSCIRDSSEINNIGISIKAINLVPNKSEKKDVGKYNLDLNFAGVTFKENQFIYSDPDGIVISSTEIILK